MHHARNHECQRPKSLSGSALHERSQLGTNGAQCSGSIGGRIENTDGYTLPKTVTMNDIIGLRGGVAIPRGFEPRPPAPQPVSCPFDYGSWWAPRSTANAERWAVCAINPERIEHVGAGHHDREGSQCVLDLDRAVVAGEHVGRAAIGLRGLVEIGAVEKNSAGAQPGLHLLRSDLPRRKHLAGFAVALAAPGARHHAAGAVDGRVEARGRCPLSMPERITASSPMERRRNHAGREGRRCALRTTQSSRSPWVSARRSCGGCERCR